MVEVDYVVVGAGAAGCVLAARLSADPSTSVLLVEHGGPGCDPLVLVPKSFVRTMSDPRHADRYPAWVSGGGEVPAGGRVSGSQVPGTAGSQRTETWLRGRGLGGSTTINGTMYARGDPADYDALAGRGGPAWSWEHMLAVFRAMEDHELGASPVRGAGGPLTVSVPQPHEEVAARLVAAGSRLGWRPVRDVNAVTGQRIGPTPTTTRAGTRVSAARAFLAPARRRSNLTVLTRTEAVSVVQAGGRAVGVRLARRRADGTLERGQVRARREVVLAAGALGSPLLLERSGIGRPDVLAHAGVTVQVDSPNVGERLVEQRAVTVKARLADHLGLGPVLGTTCGRLRSGARYALTRSGPLSTAAYELCALVSTTGGRPDAQLLFTALATVGTGLAADPEPGLMIQGYPLRPTTAGSVHLTGPDPWDVPRIDARFLVTDQDRRVTGRILELARELLATAPLADVVRGELLPGPAVLGEDGAVRHAMDSGTGIYHAVGSCAVGPTEGDVVDGELRVRGVAGLRVVDASVFPVQPAGGMAAPTMALAWRAADLLAGDGSGGTGAA